MNIMIILMWIPAHRGRKGNEKVDSLAKQALKNIVSYGLESLFLYLKRTEFIFFNENGKLWSTLNTVGGDNAP